MYKYKFIKCNGWNKTQEAEETDSSMTSKRNNSSSSLDNHDTQTAIVMAERKDTDLISEEYRCKKGKKLIYSGPSKGSSS